MASAIQDASQNVQAARKQSNDGSEKAENTVHHKERRTFARSILLQPGNLEQLSQIRKLNALAPSAHHRFNKESVHLRNMYR